MEMDITVRNKQELQNRIIEAKIGIQLSKDILEQVKLFEHRKRVDKTFTDSFDTLGYHAYISKDKYCSKLVIRKRVEDENHKSQGWNYVEISIYHSEIMERRPFSWEEIKREVEKYDYAGRLATAQEALRCADDEAILFKNFVDYVEKQDFKCFDLWRIKSDLKHAIDIFIKNK
jgi:hypothetical protein